MSTTNQKNRALAIVAIVGLVALAAAAYATTAKWMPLVERLIGETTDDDPSETGNHAPHGVLPVAGIELSARGLKNVGFVPHVIELSPYERRLRLPAMVVERPGRSQVHITAPLTGVVTKIMAVPGEAVEPGSPLFQSRLTHEELVAAQRQFLENLATQQVVEEELARLKGLGEGVIAGKRIIEQRYEQQKLQAALLAAEQAMLLHGLTDEQIAEIRETKELFRNITINAPEHEAQDEACDVPHLFTVQRLSVAKGEHVEMGRELAMLADHCELYIEAIAFEDDAQAIRTAAANDREVTARRLQDEAADAVLTGLTIQYVASQIDPESRALKVYVRLPNRVALDRRLPGGKKFLEWVYKPGQRMQLLVPVETWENQIVAPTTAVVEEGAENYVYVQNGDVLVQRPVHVVHRDQKAVVLANDGALFPGDVIAGQGAYQIHLAMKNQSGAAIDPHAGHNH